MPVCNKCQNPFPNTMKVDGVRKNLSSRRYCLICSPFGQHNTRKIEANKKERAWFSAEPCRSCGSETRKKAPRMHVCYVCVNKQNEKKKGDMLYDLVGNACWNPECGYDKGKDGRRMLDFHHLADKDFELNIRHVGQLSWQRILKEANKCVLLCCRCHREAHAGLISESIIKSLHEQRWRDYKQAHNSAARVPA